MDSISKEMREYQRALQSGVLQKAYQGLMEFFRELRLKMEKVAPGAKVSAIQYGLMDFTYFFCAPPALATRRLKIAVLFDHGAFAFELWLVGSNKEIQGQYQRVLATHGWNKDDLAVRTKGVYHIVRRVLIEDPQFDDMGGLAETICSGTIDFAREVERFLETKDD